MNKRKDSDVLLYNNCISKLKDEEKDICGLVEAILFISNEPLHISFFVNKLGFSLSNIRTILDFLMEFYEKRDGGIVLIEAPQGFQFVLNNKYTSQIRSVMGINKNTTLSRAMLETLAIIAYKQPAILAEIEELRGASSRMILTNLLKKKLIKPVGRKNLPGRPIAYGTTDEFLGFLGLKSLADLPSMSEIMEFPFESED